MRRSPSTTRVLRVTSDSDTLSSRVVDAAVARAVPHDAARRRFLRTVGSSTALARSPFFPLAAARIEPLRRTRGAREPSIRSGSFHHLRDAHHHVAADGLYARQGLNVDGEDRGLGGDPRQDPQQDTTRRMLSPMPLAITLGGAVRTISAVENQRPGHHARHRHKDKRDPKRGRVQVRGAFDYSMHNYLLRYYVASTASTDRTSRSAGAAARNGGESARRQHRRFRAGSGQPARGL